MDDVTFKTIDGGMTLVTGAALQELQAGLCSQLAFPGDPGYEEARSLWNAMIDRRPALVVRCTGAADVQAAVNLASEHGLLTSIRGGGHNIAGSAVSDGGLMIDLSPMRGIRVDPGSRRVWVQPGTTWGDVDRETQPFGLAVPSGIVSTTGVAGLTLGGGFGWLTRTWGYTVDWLRSVEIVTASGQILKASPEQHPDLFWGLTGGGGNFGVVTGFEFESVPAGPTVMAGFVFHPFEQAAELMRFFREITSTAPDELTCLFAIRTAPPAPFIPVAYHGKLVAGIGVLYSGTLEAAEPHVKPVKEFGSPIADVIQPKPFTAHQTFLDSSQPHGRRYYWKSEYVDSLSDELIDIALDHWQRVTSPMSSMLVLQLGGAGKRGPVGATAVGHRDAEFVFNIQASWEDAAETERHVAWARAFYADVHPHSSGVYVNFLTEDEGDDRVRQAYHPDIYRRLVEVKSRYDPGNLFRLNKNIKPRIDAAREPQAASTNHYPARPG